MIRTTRVSCALAAVAALIATAAACGKEGSPPTKGPAADKLPNYQVVEGFQLPDSPTWKRADKRGYFTVGAKEDQPYLGEKNPASGTYSGFDIEIAKMMSASLGSARRRSASRRSLRRTAKPPCRTGRSTTTSAPTPSTTCARNSSASPARTTWRVSPCWCARTRTTSTAHRTSQAGPSARRPVRPLPAHQGGLPEGETRRLRHVLGLRRQPAHLPGRRRHHRRRDPDRLRGEGSRRTQGRRQAVLRGAVRHRCTARRQRAAVRTRRRTGGPREERRLEEGVRGDARPVRRTRAHSAQDRPLSGELRPS